MIQKNRTRIIKVEGGVVYRRSECLRGCLKLLGVVVVGIGAAIMHQAIQIDHFSLSMMAVIGGGIVAYGGGCLYICIQFSEFGYLWFKETSNGIPVPDYKGNRHGNTA